jgi:cell filamentation protein
MKSSASRYVTALGDEGEFEPGSHGRVLKNLIGITSKREMDRVENLELRKCEKYFADVVTTEMSLTLDFIFEMHRCFLG